MFAFQRIIDQCNYEQCIWRDKHSFQISVFFDRLCLKYSPQKKKKKRKTPDSISYDIHVQMYVNNKSGCNIVKNWWQNKKSSILKPYFNFLTLKLCIAFISLTTCYAFVFTSFCLRPLFLEIEIRKKSKGCFPNETLWLYLWKSTLALYFLVPPSVFL